MQSKLGDVLNDADRLESASLNGSDGGEECEAIITALRRAKRRTSRPLDIASKSNLSAVDEMEVETEGDLAGKALPTVRLTMNGH
jgi:hypothetical protein